MYMIETSAAFDSAHFLSGYNGKCANIHGHRWVIKAACEENDLIADGEKRGMVMDFSDLKNAVRALADSYDHALLYEKGTLKEKTIEALNEEGFHLIELPYRPTAENFAHAFYNALRMQGVKVKKVAVYETPENCAVFSEDKSCSYIPLLKSL